MAKIDELKFDDKNFNKHTEYGMSLISKSLQELGAGRSILIDKDNNIIAGNGIVEAAGQVGLENVKIVETDGSEIIAVKRTDMALDSEKGREMALADNATASADLEWDEDMLGEVFDDEDLDKWGVSLEEDELLGAEEVFDISPLQTSYTQKHQIDDFKFDEAVEVDERYKELKGKIETCKNPELKKVLEERLKDFKDFKFDYIADYYLSGANKEERELIAQFGLVIPTEKEALENSYLDLERSVILG